MRGTEDVGSTAGEELPQALSPPPVPQYELWFAPESMLGSSGSRPWPGTGTKKAWKAVFGRRAPDLNCANAPQALCLRQPRNR